MPSIAGVDHDTIADEADLGVAGDLTVEHHTTGHGTHFGDLEHFADLDVADDLLFDFRGKHPSMAALISSMAS